MIHRYAQRSLYAFILGAVLLHPVLLAQPHRYSLEELKQFAERNYEALRIQSLAADQAALRVGYTSAQRLPRLDADASYTWVSETSKIEFALPGIFQRTMELGDGNNYSAGLTVSAPLFMGYKLATAVEMQKETQQIARQTLAGNKVEVRNAVTKQYLLAILADKSATILDAQAALLSRTLDNAKQFVAQAQAIPYDTLVISTRMSQLLLERLNAGYMHQRALLILMQLSGIREDLAIAELPPPELPVADYAPNSLLDEAIQNRYEIKNLGAQRRLAELSVKSDQSAYYPSISAFASYKYGKPGIDQFKNEWMDYFTAGIVLKWNLWSWNADKNKVEEQRIEREKTELRERQFVNALKMQIASAANDIELSRNTMMLVRVQIAQEEQKTAIVQSRHAQGLATSTEVVDAETSLTASKLKLEQATIDYSMKLNELAGLLGKEL